LVIDGSGNLYGTTLNGGDASCGGFPSGCGVVFELSPQAGGGWTEKILHSFIDNGKDGSHPAASLTLDRSGNLYGTTVGGGGGVCITPFAGCGVVFELLPQPGGRWTERILHSFNVNGTDGSLPYSSLTLDASGYLYGTTDSGGVFNDGTVFELKPTPPNGWSEKILHNFSQSSKDGCCSLTSLLVDSAGNLYGGSGDGGDGSCNSGCGLVFELLPQADGSWSERILYSFQNNGTDGFGSSALTRDAAGNLYGTSTFGGAYGDGTAFEITP
jgi:uncharacterized repeat protein (TIGR03803 family)